MVGKVRVATKRQFVKLLIDYKMIGQRPFSNFVKNLLNFPQLLLCKEIASSLCCCRRWTTFGTGLHKGRERELKIEEETIFRFIFLGEVHAKYWGGMIGGRKGGKNWSNDGNECGILLVYNKFYQFLVVVFFALRGRDVIRKW